MTDPNELFPEDSADLKAIDDLLPHEISEAIIQWRDICRGAWIGIAEVKAREALKSLE